VGLTSQRTGETEELSPDAAMDYLTDIYVGI